MVPNYKKEGVSNDRWSNENMWSTIYRWNRFMYDIGFSITYNCFTKGTNR